MVYVPLTKIYSPTQNYVGIFVLNIQTDLNFFPGCTEQAHTIFQIPSKPRENHRGKHLVCMICYHHDNLFQMNLFILCSKYIIFIYDQSNHVVPLINI